MVERFVAIETAALRGLPAVARWRGRIAVRLAMGVGPWGLFFAAVFAALGRPLDALSLCVAALAVGSGPWVLPRLGLQRTGVLMTAGLFQSLILPATSTKGVASGSLPWLTLCVVLGFVLSGVRWGMAWTLIAVGSMVTLAVFEAQGALPIGPGLSEDAALFLSTSANIGLFVVVGVTAFASLRAVEAQRRALVDARKAAMRANEAKSDFLASMSHELRTPLNAILGYAELLEEEASPADAEDLQRIHGAGTHLLGLVNDILNLSKVESGQMPLTIETVEVPPLAETIGHQLAPLFATVPLRIDTQGRCRADPVRLRQCLINLLSNAARFTDSGEVTLEGRPHEGRYRLVVRDTGIGMAPEVTARVFEPFVQGHGDERGGTGLGLAIVRELVKRMDGEVTVESTLGKGTCFVIDLPR